MTPLLLITGFLGSGKTSLLRQILPTLGQVGIRAHVILNDYANAAVDSATLRGLADDVIPITGGCVCCDSLDDLLAELEDMPLGDRDAVLVESNGTTDPLPLLERLLLLPNITRRFPVVLQVNLVDAKRWGCHLHRDLERMQTRAASHLMFTWLDQVGDARQFQVQQEVRRLNPHARAVNCEELAAELAGFVEMNARDLVRSSFATLDRTRALRIAPLSGLGVPKEDNIASVFRRSKPDWTGAHSHSLAHRYSAMQLVMPRELRPLQLATWLESLPKSVIRAKGIVQFADHPHTFYFFHRVDDLVSFGEMSWPPPDGLTLALLIGIGLDEPALRREAFRHLSLEQCEEGNPGESRLGSRALSEEITP